MTQVLMSIGSNLNQPRMQIEQAVERLKERFDQVVMSSLYLTEPLGGIPQDAFVNAGIRLDTQLTARELLQYLMELEGLAHRDRKRDQPNGPRTLDLDIILFGDQVLTGSELTIPHPRFRDRQFVLVPLNEIAPEMVDPLSGKAISQLLEECQDTSWVKQMDEEVLSL